MGCWSPLPRALCTARRAASRTWLLRYGFCGCIAKSLLLCGFRGRFFIWLLYRSRARRVLLALVSVAHNPEGLGLQLARRLRSVHGVQRCPIATPRVCVHLSTSDHKIGSKLCKDSTTTAANKNVHEDDEQILHFHTDAHGELSARRSLFQAQHSGQP